MPNMLSTLIQAYPAIQTGLKGKNLKAQRGTADQMAQLARAQYDTSSPAFQNLYAQNREAGNQDLAATIAELSRQNRKQVSMGRAPLLSSERGGEDIFRNLIKGQQDVGTAARSNTFGQLRQAQGSVGQLYNTQNDLTSEDYNNKLRRVGASYSIGDALKGLFGL